MSRLFSKTFIAAMAIALSCPAFAAEPPAVDDKCKFPFGKEERQDRPTIALALGGGGMRGAAHVGVIRVLLDEGIPIDCVAGTSMGSVVGGLLSAGVHPDEIEKHFTHGDLMHSFITVPLGLRLAAIPVFYVPRLFGVRPYEGFYRGNRFCNYLNKMVPHCGQNIENLGIPFCAVAVDLYDGKEYAITKGNLGRALQASCAVPVLRRPVEIDGRLYVDGGVLVNLPVEHAREMGADMVIAVDVDETPGVAKDREFRTLGGVAHRVLTLNLWKVDELQRKHADVIIHPNVNGIGLISTKTKDARTAIAAGEAAARAALPEIKKRFAELAQRQALK